MVLRKRILSLCALASLFTERYSRLATSYSINASQESLRSYYKDVLRTRFRDLTSARAHKDGTFNDALLSGLPTTRYPGIHAPAQYGIHAHSQPHGHTFSRRHSHRL